MTSRDQNAFVHTYVLVLSDIRFDVFDQIESSAWSFPFKYSAL